MSCGGGKKPEVKEGKRPKKSTHLQIIATVKEKEQHNIEHENGSIHFPMAGIRAKKGAKRAKSRAHSHSRVKLTCIIHTYI